MKVLLSWIHEFLPSKPRAEEVRNALTSVGIEVGSLVYLGGGMEDVVIARILKIGRHPGADRLTVCRVTDGTQEYSIVCGATNQKEGDFAALARAGAKLPNGGVVKKSKIRGETSEGMLCSESELGLSAESEGILILPGNSKLGAPLAGALGRDDWLLELELTPNRGDCLSVVGVAREVAAALDVSPKIPDVAGEGPPDSKLSAFVDDGEGAPRYVLRRIDGLKSGLSPAWIRNRLEACGVRAISNLVDVTNYVMLERGQPMHAFDQAKVVGAVRVRRAKKGEALLCLDDVERKLNERDLVIADDKGPIALAGVMGGKRTAVGDTTESILLESAFFDPKSLRRTAAGQSCHSESSHRFERGVDPSGCWTASTRALQLLGEAGGGKEVSGVDLRFRAPVPAKLKLRKATLLRILGDETRNGGEYLSRLGFSVEKLEEDWLVEVPTRRPDLEREIDLVEEVARIHGYDRFASLLPSTGHEPEQHEAYELADRIRDLLAACGLMEVRTYSFSSENDLKMFPGKLTASPLRLSNPLTTDAGWMRQSLLPNLIAAWRTNQARQVQGGGFFEIGSVFGVALPGMEIPAFEQSRLGILLAGRIRTKFWHSPERNADFFDAKGVLETLFDRLGWGAFQLEARASSTYLHEGKSARVLFRRKEVGELGCLHPRVLRGLDLPGPVILLDLDLTTFQAFGNSAARFKALSAFPTVRRDLAFVVRKEISWDQVLGVIKKLQDPLLQDVELFDVYEGKGMAENERSLAFAMTFGSAERTLTDNEVEASLKRIATEIQKDCGAQLRGEFQP
ncbi:MAG: phenylalanine--tRNA ligase subunit beta [Pseudomonadota bacterium]